MPRLGHHWLALVVLFSVGTFFVNDRYHSHLTVRHGTSAQASRTEAARQRPAPAQGDERLPLGTAGPPLPAATAPRAERTSDAAAALDGRRSELTEKEEEEEGDAGLSEMFAAAAHQPDEDAAAAAAAEYTLPLNIVSTGGGNQEEQPAAADQAAPQMAAQIALQDWLHPGPDVKARPESEYGPLTMTRPSLERRGAFFVPKVDNPEERVWPPPDIKLQGRPTSRMYTKEWNHARGHVWRKLLRLLPDSDVAQSWKFRSCAVVGNGGSVLLYSKGEEISAHDAIIRFNRGVRRGFEQYVGNRTTIRIVNRNNIGFHEEGDEVILQQVTAPDAFERFLNVTASSSSALPIYGIATEFHALVLERYQKLLQGTNADLQSLMGWRYQGEKLKWDSPATNGFYGVTLALQRCARVSLYGFARAWGKPSAAAPQLKLRYHYYDNEEPIKAQTDRDNDEFVGLASLVRVLRRRIRFAEPCIAGCAGKMVDSSRDPHSCPQCPSGSWCSCSAWHPVPRPGFCFFPGGGASGLRCFYKCVNSRVCPGGHLGVCPADPSMYEAGACHG